MRLSLRSLMALTAAAVMMNAVAIAPAMAQAFPARRVTIVIPFPPGGGIDILMRAMGQELALRQAMRDDSAINGEMIRAAGVKAE